jgi:hypothetical protein
MHNLICMLHMFRPYVIHQHIMEVTKETASRWIHQLWTAHFKDSQLLRNCLVTAHKQLPWSTTQQTKLISHAASPHVQPKIP